MDSLHSWTNPVVPAISCRHVKNGRIRDAFGQAPRLPTSLLQLRFFEKAAAVSRLEAQPRLAAIAHDPHGNRGACGTAAPELAVEVRQTVDLLVTHIRNDVAATQPR